MTKGLVVQRDRSLWVDITPEEQANRDEIRQKNETKQAEKKAAQAAKKEALKVAENAGLDGLRGVVALLVWYEVTRDD